MIATLITTAATINGFERICFIGFGLLDSELPGPIGITPQA